MVSLTEIVEKAKGYYKKVDIDLINKAYVYSAHMHDGQFRKSGEPYFIHPMGVANITTQMRLDSASISAGLLHDVIEDAGVSSKDLAEQFGKDVAFLVEGVTKLGKLNFISREDRQAESFRKMLVAMSRDIRVLLVKLADRLDNMRTLEHMSPEAQERVARETMEIYAPLAARLGIQWLKNELEDLSFKYLYPDAYLQVSNKLQKIAKDSDKYIQEVVRELQQILVKNNFHAEVNGRIKLPYSIYRKMRENQCEFEQIHDLIAIRVVIEGIASCYAALGEVHSCWTPVPGRFKDYIALPKSNMYQSLHTTVIGPNRRRVEVQIRTPQMHRTAEIGIAAHWTYKERGISFSQEDIDKFTWLRNLLEYQKQVIDPDEFLDGVKVDLFSDEVYVFTPKGDVLSFPRGATPVDFAYAVHSEIGHHCSGARIEGSIVPLNYKLHNGDTVEILTSHRQQPSNDWLGFVASARARSRIRNFIRIEEHKRSVNLGHHLLEREMRKRGLSFSRMVKNDCLDKAIEAYRVSSADELFGQIGYGKLHASQIIESFCPKEDAKAVELLRPGILEKAVDRVVQKITSDDIMIDEIGDVLVRFAKCCNPVPGDPITGWITRGRGVTVHRRGCTRAMELEPERRINVNWSSIPKGNHRVVLRVLTADRPGILANLSRKFNDGGINITEANCRTTDEGRAINTFQFAIGDVARLNALMRSLTKVDGVYEVKRV
jgi:GTP pyrophosphokinase